MGESLSALPDEVTSDLVELPFGVDQVELDKVLGMSGVLAQAASAAAGVGNLQGLVRLTVAGCSSWTQGCGGLCASPRTPWPR